MIGKSSIGKTYECSRHPKQTRTGTVVLNSRSFDAKLQWLIPEYPRSRVMVTIYWVAYS